MVNASDLVFKEEARNNNIPPKRIYFLSQFDWGNLFSESVEHTASVDRSKCYFVLCFNQISNQENSSYT